MVESHLEGLSAETMVTIVVLDVDDVLDEGLHVSLFFALAVLLI